MGRKSIPWWEDAPKAASVVRSSMSLTCGCENSKLVRLGQDKVCEKCGAKNPLRALREEMSDDTVRYIRNGIRVPTCSKGTKV